MFQPQQRPFWILWLGKREVALLWMEQAMKEFGETLGKVIFEVKISDS